MHVLMFNQKKIILQIETNILSKKKKKIRNKIFIDKDSKVQVNDEESFPHIQNLNKRRDGQDFCNTPTIHVHQDSITWNYTKKKWLSYIFYTESKSNDWKVQVKDEESFHIQNLNKRRDGQDFCNIPTRHVRQYSITWNYTKKKWLSTL